MSKHKKQSHPYPMACGYSLSEKDTHEHCPLCLEFVHAKLALFNPGACVHCQQLRRSTLERRVAFVERVLGEADVSHSPLLSFGG